MENEFDFFNALNFQTDFSKQGLGGYGTYDRYQTRIGLPINPPRLITPLNPDASKLGIEQLIQNPLVKQLGYIDDGQDRGKIPNLKTSTYNATLEDEVNPEDLENAKKDTNINNLINMGLFDKAKDYVKNNYGYMIMNVIFPGSGYVAKAFVETKKKKEAAAAEELAKIEEEKKQEVIRQAAYEQARKDKVTYAALEKSITSGQGGQGYDRPSSGATAVGAGMGVGGGYSTDYGFKDGGRIGYGTGGIVTL